MRVLEDQRKRFVHHLEEVYAALAAESGGADLTRVRGYVDNLVGRTHRVPEHPLQKVPRATFVPGVRHQPWHDAAQFPEARALERHYPVIAREFAAARAASTLPEYGREAQHRDGDRYNNATGRWSALHLRQNGVPQARGIAACPQTWALLQSFDLATEVVFSSLAPGAEIVPHSDRDNLILTLHLGISIPPGCHFTVGGETRRWSEGRCLAFENSFVHSAHNFGDRDRVVLMVDLWHPDLAPVELAAIRTLQHAIVRSLSGSG